MTNDKTTSWTITTFKITTILHDKVTKFNKENPNDKINVSGICREAIEHELKWRIQHIKKYKGAYRT